MIVCSIKRKTPRLRIKAVEYIFLLVTVSVPSGPTEIIRLSLTKNNAVPYRFEWLTVGPSSTVVNLELPPKGHHRAKEEVLVS